MLPLFDLPPERQDEPDKPVDPHRYFLWRYFADNKKCALMGSHDNGGPDFCPLDELTRQPQLYASYHGANRGRHYQEIVHGEHSLYIERWDPALKQQR